MQWSRWLTALGILIMIAGVVIGIWLQTTIPSQAAFGKLGHDLAVQQRLSEAAVGVGMIGAGALLAVAAHIMGMMQAAQVQESN